MFADRALKFCDDRRLQSGQVLGHGQAIRFQVRLVSEANEMRDEAKPGLAALQLTEENVIGLDVCGDRLEVASISRLAKDGGIADHRNAIGIDLREPLDDEIGQRGNRAIVFRASGLVIENGNGDHDGRLSARREAPDQQRYRENQEPGTQQNQTPGTPGTSGTAGTAGDDIRGDRSDEFESPLGDCLNEARILSAIAENGPNLRHAVRQAAIEVDVRVLAPHGVAQLLAAGDIAAFREEQRQGFRRLGLERDRPPVLAQFPAQVVEFKDAEAINHPTQVYPSPREGHMSQINIGGVLKGGLAAGLIMNISEFILNVPVAGAQMDAELLSHNLPPVGNGAIAIFTAVTFLLGIATVWLYAAIRPRLGPGPKTAMVAGVVVWALSYAYASVFFYMLGMQSLGLVVLGVVWSAIEMIVASSVGAYLYKEA